MRILHEVEDRYPITHRGEELDAGRIKGKISLAIDGTQQVGKLRYRCQQ